MSKDTETPPERILEEWLFCPLCHAELDYEYDIDYVLLRLEERCQCTRCGYRRHPLEATLQ